MHNKERIFMESNGITIASWLFLTFSFRFKKIKEKSFLFAENMKNRPF